MNDYRVNPEEFQKSITRELDIIKDRVRNLIGNSNWGEEGRYKEAILRNVIKRFLPTDLSIGTGFIIKKDDRTEQISSQIDIIIYDNKIPALFFEGDFIITTHKNVKAIIETKTKVRTSDLEQIINKAEKNGRLINGNIFNGIFSYEYRNNNSYENLAGVLEKANGYVNHLALGCNVFIKYWKKEDGSKLSPAIENCNNDFYNIYKLENLSF
ncbi:MAG: hypothetical protein N2043_00520 [Ignavibacterium sp.]|nr:hypothetical protein [Ignavibacterium sp.]